MRLCFKTLLKNKNGSICYSVPWPTEVSRGWESRACFNVGFVVTKSKSKCCFGFVDVLACIALDEIYDIFRGTGDGLPYFELVDGVETRNDTCCLA